MVYDIDEVCVYVFFMTSTRCVPRCMVGHKFPMILPKENENRLKVRRPEVSSTSVMKERVMEGRYYVFGGLLYQIK